jgi:hypothetical protein
MRSRCMIETFSHSLHFYLHLQLVERKEYLFMDPGSIYRPPILHISRTLRPVVYNTSRGVEDGAFQKMSNLFIEVSQTTIMMQPVVQST